MEQNLNFVSTMTVEQFKNKVNANKIEIKRNPMTSKLFMTWGPGREHIGAVSAKGIPSNPVISQVATAEGETFYLMHEEGNGGAPTLATF